MHWRLRFTMIRICPEEWCSSFQHAADCTASDSAEFEEIVAELHRQTAEVQRMTRQR